MEFSCIGRFLFIPDWISRDIKVYTTSGEFLYTIGVSGEGPGEFRDVRGGITVLNDTLIIIDLALQRVNLFQTEGEFIRSFQFPASLHYTGSLAELFEVDSTLVMPVYENKYAPIEEYHKSRTIAFLNLEGNIQQLIGKHPEEYSRFNMYSPNVSITIDNNNHIYQLSHASPVIHTYNETGELLNRFGVAGEHYQAVSFDYSPNMPIEEIERLALKKSSTSNIHWLTSGYILHEYLNITEESQTKRDPMLHERYIQVYTDDGIYIPSDIPLPGVLLTVDEDGLLYILTDHTPGNRTIDVYELHIEITEE